MLRDLAVYTFFRKPAALQQIDYRIDWKEEHHSARRVNQVSKDFLAQLSKVINAANWTQSKKEITEPP